MPSLKERHEKLFGSGEGTGRIEYFSDGVMAIALTLLVLDIRSPEVADDQLMPALLDLWPNYLAYGLSFWIIAINWIGHYRRFRVIERFDTKLIYINFVYLLFVALVPFPTSVLSQYGAVIPAVMLYAAMVCALGVLQIWMWTHARNAGLLSKDVDDDVFHYVRRHLAVAPIVFGISVAVALISPWLAMWSWFLLWPINMLVQRWHRRAAS